MWLFKKNHEIQVVYSYSQSSKPQKKVSKLCDIWKVRKWVTVSHKNSQDAFKLHQNLPVIQTATIQHNKQEAKSNTGHQQLPSAGGQETPERRDGDDWTQVRHMKVIRDKTKTWRTGHRT